MPDRVRNDIFPHQIPRWIQMSGKQNLQITQKTYYCPENILQKHCKTVQIKYEMCKKVQKHFCKNMLLHFLQVYIFCNLGMRLTKL